jgi:hypothetical protein
MRDFRSVHLNRTSLLYRIQLRFLRLIILLPLLQQRKASGTKSENPGIRASNMLVERALLESAGGRGFRYFVSIVGDQDSERKTLIAIASKFA